MTTRADVNRLTAAQRRLVSLAQGEIASFFGTLDLARPEAVRDALLEIVPSLVREYGDLAAVAAAEWYEQVHPGRFVARTAEGVATDQIAGTVRFAAGHLFGDDPVTTLAVLNGAVQRFVAYGARSTVSRNVALDPSRPRFARVPSGSETCAFCLMLASRGWVYHSRATAGEFEHWHDDCDCQVTPQWDAQDEIIAGYDPDALFEVYSEARRLAGTSDVNSILAAVRQIGGVTDAHVH